MKSNRKTIKNNILLYLIIFSIVILVFLWIFQIFLLNIYYKISKTNEINDALNSVITNYNINNYTSTLNSISQKNDVCIDLIYNNKIIYSTSDYNSDCMSKTNDTLNHFQDTFIKRNIKKSSVEIINPAFNNKTLLVGQKLDNETHVFVNASLVPLDNSIKILKDQFIYVSIIILFISICLSYFISRKISKPIIELNESAKRLSKKDYTVIFPENDEILEINELANTLNKTTKELAKTDELRRELMANVSHDLKTPLTMIKAYAEAARDLNTNKKEKREENLNIIINETERLNILVNDILELSKIEAKAYKLKEENFNITELISSILKRFDILKKEGYKFIFDNEINYYISADKEKIDRAIYNLINNAINYAGDDKIIEIKLIPNKNKIRVEIIDNGVGIAKDDLELIWEKYYRIDKHHKRNKYGTGIGLSIVKGILENHNFKYGVISKKKKGTTFYFEANIVKQNDKKR